MYHQKLLSGGSNLRKAPCYADLPGEVWRIAGQVLAWMQYVSTNVPHLPNTKSNLCIFFSHLFLIKPLFTAITITWFTGENVTTNYSIIKNESLTEAVRSIFSKISCITIVRKRKRRMLKSNRRIATLKYWSPTYLR